MALQNRLMLLSAMMFILVMQPASVFAAPAPDRAWEILENYSLVEIIKPLLIVVLIAIFAAYLWTMHDISKKHDIQHKNWKAVSFFVGLVIIYISLAGPIGIYADRQTFSMHTLQQGLMYLGMPLAVLLGMPRVFYVYLDKKLLSQGILRVFKIPIVNILLFNLLLSFLYIPFIYEFLIDQVILLEMVHVLINIAAFSMWIHVLAPDGLINNMGGLLKLGYIFMNGLLLTPLCALIIFAEDIIYPSINEAPLPFPVSNHIEDQMLSGIILQILQQLFFFVTITFIFFRWAAVNEKVYKVDELPQDQY